MFLLSIVFSLLHLVDPVQARAIELERKSVREQAQRDPDRDPPGGVLPEVTRRERPAQCFACRVCGHQGESAGYCPHCLADTMKPVRRK